MNTADIVPLLVLLQVTHRAIVDHGAAPVQARTNVHPGRGRRGPGPVAYAEHRPPDKVTLQGLAVHRR